jgi:hypothetical protein
MIFPDKARLDAALTLQMSTHIYEHALVPFIRDHEGRIDTFLEFLHIVSTFTAHHLFAVPMEHLARLTRRIPVSSSDNATESLLHDLPLPGGLAWARTSPATPPAMLPATPPATRPYVPSAMLVDTPHTTPLPVARVRPRRTPKTPKRPAAIHPAVAERHRPPAAGKPDKPRRHIRRDLTSTQSTSRPTPPPPVAPRPADAPALVSVNVPKRDAPARVPVTTLPKSTVGKKTASATTLAPLTPGRKRKAAPDDQPEPGPDTTIIARRPIKTTLKAKSTLKAGGPVDAATARPPPVKRRKVERVIVEPTDGTVPEAPRPARKRRADDGTEPATKTQATRRTRPRQIRDVRLDDQTGERKQAAL